MTTFLVQKMSLSKSIIIWGKTVSFWTNKVAIWWLQRERTRARGKRNHKSLTYMIWGIKYLCKESRGIVKKWYYETVCFYWWKLLQSRLGNYLAPTLPTFFCLKCATSLFISFEISANTEPKTSILNFF